MGVPEWEQLGGQLGGDRAIMRGRTELDWVFKWSIPGATAAKVFEEVTTVQTWSLLS